MSPLARRGRELSRRLWRTTRHDIGRKLTALFMAVALWSALQNFVIDKQPLNLEVHAVATQDEANSKRATTAGVYLIVPDDLIVRSVSDPRVHVTVTGLRDEVAGLNMSAVLPFFVADLGGADEVKLKQPLERDVFGVPPGQVSPRLTGFRVRPDVLEITLARRDTGEVTLTADNVVTAGKPKEGYLFKSSRISMVPSTVSITGPRQVMVPLLADPSRIKLEPVAVGGKSFTVSQAVGLAQELRDQGVSLQSGGGQIVVTVPIEPEDITRDLFAVPIEYRNEDALDLRQQRATGFPRTLDIRVVGPPAALERRDEDLLAKIVLVFDWKNAPASFEDQATGKVTAYTAGLPDTVRVTDQKDKDLKLEYTLESVTPAGAADDK